MAEDLSTAVEASGASPGHNGFDPNKLNDHIEGIEEAEGKIEDIMADAAERCLPHRADIKNRKKEARTALNIKAVPLNGALRDRKLERKRAAISSTMDEADKETFDQVMFALGGLADTPLGESALEQAVH